MVDIDGTHVKIQIPVEFEANSDLQQEKIQEGLAELSGAVAFLTDGVEVVMKLSDDPAGLIRGAVQGGLAG